LQTVVVQQKSGPAITPDLAATKCAKIALSDEHDDIVITGWHRYKRTADM